MKRFIAGLLVLIFSCSCTLAFADDPKEITFQGIPWFSSPQEVSALLYESGFTGFEFGDIAKDIFTASARENKLKRRGNPYAVSLVGYDASNKNCPYTYASEKNLPITSKLREMHFSQSYKFLKTIAKQRVTSMRLYFTPDADNPQLVQCAVYFASDKGYKDAIINALKEAFGKPVSEKNKCYIWMGENDTIAMFYPKNKCVIFATIDGLELAETYDVEIPEASSEPEDTGF